MLEQLKDQLTSLLKQLPKNNLVCSTSGNISARDKTTNLIIIKPSGIPYELIEPQHLVVLDTNGKIVEGNCKPSSDTKSHLYIYQNRDDIFGITHTHSKYATAFAAHGSEIPVFITETAEEFGGAIPCAEFVLIGDDEIGRQVIKNGNTSNAVLLKKHGVFTMGNSPQKALDLAIYVENSAHIAWLALQIGKPDEISSEDIHALYSRQQNIYGQ